MVARIRCGKNLKGAIYYNEQKLSKGTAVLILARGYSKDPGNLGLKEKHSRLQKLADLNTRVGTHCVHISLNFDPSEQLNTEVLCHIATDYMKGIGFEKQPFLVYEHKDAAHQHLHIVSTNVDRFGKRIALHNIGRGPSEIARKEIESKYQLVRAGPEKLADQSRLKPVNIEKAIYGRDTTKRAITNIVTAVRKEYTFTSLAELNAVLNCFNILADRGGMHSRMFQKGGLIYYIIDSQGKPKGIPVKASSIDGKPTLAGLKFQFEANRSRKYPFRNLLVNSIEKVLCNATSRADFARKMKESGVDVVYRQNSAGYVYGVTYVDHSTKSVFNGSELGKEYSAYGLAKRLATNQSIQEQKQPDVIRQDFEGNRPGKPAKFPSETALSGTLKVDSEGEKTRKPDFISRVCTINATPTLKHIEILEGLIEPADTNAWLPFPLRRSKRKKKKK